MRLRTLVVIAVLAAFAAGGAGAGVVKLKGLITADGSSTVGPYTRAAAELFRKKEPGVQVTVGISGTGGGFQRFCNNEIDLADASRAIRKAEIEACQKNSVRWVAFTVANDGISLVVNKQNTWANCLTTAELKKIWEPGSKVNNWREVRSSFPDVSLKLFGPGTDSGTFDFFTEVINGRARASRSDYSATENDNVAVRGVEGERGGMAYFGLSYYEENKNRLKVLAVDSGRGCIKPSKTTVQKNSYKPLSRPLFVYVKGSSFKKRHVQAFLDYMFDNEVRIANRARFISLTPQQLKRARHHFHFQLLKLQRSG
jgi:phosphate transport system substrate-binding protein